MYLKNDRILTGFSIMLDVAFYAGRSDVVSGADIAQRNGLLRRGIEPVLQALSRAELLDSVRGPRGGYRLGRSPRLITLQEIAGAVAINMATENPDTDTQSLMHRVMLPFWHELDGVVEQKLATITLDDLVHKAEERGFPRPVQAPISFSI